jgi:hypothetical protein
MVARWAALSPDSAHFIDKMPAAPRDNPRRLALDKDLQAVFIDSRGAPEVIPRSATSRVVLRIMGFVAKFRCVCPYHVAFRCRGNRCGQSPTMVVVDRCKA